MHPVSFIILLVLLPGLCAPVQGGSTTQLDNGDFHTVIDATAGGAFATEAHDFTYFSFERGEVVPITDAEAATSSDWHIGFKRSEIKLNGGISGPGQVKGFDFNGTEDMAAADGFDAVSEADVPGADAFVADGPAYAIGEWFSYDPAARSLDVPGNAYELRTADGSFAKFVVDGIEGAGRGDAGRITFRWVAADGENLEGEARSATVDVSGGQEAYFNLSAGEQITPADPATSMGWDLHFSGYVIRLNGGISGPGQGGAFPAYQTGQTFEDITRAMGFGYFADKAGSAFSSDSGEWYSYDSETHLLSTRNHVYIIDTGAAFYKMQILNFYLEVEGSPVSGFVTFRWRPLGSPEATAVQFSSWGKLKDRFRESN